MTDVTETPTKPKQPLRGAALLGAGPGRPKGSVNKVTVDLRNMIQGALVKAGGVAYLERCARDPRTASAFLSLVGKTLPLTVNGAGPNGEHVVTHIEIHVVDPRTVEWQPSESPLLEHSSR